MRHFRAEEEPETPQNEAVRGLSFEKKLERALKRVSRLLLFVQFTVNYGYAIENVWVTMLMIVHGTPDHVDAFVWIIPIVVAVLVRPYLVQWVHGRSYRVYQQIYLVSISLLLGALGCFICGYSCQFTQKRQTFQRILICIIGWTLMDLSFQLAQFFAEKVELSQGQLSGETDEEAHLGRKENFEFYGLLLGYVVSLLICWIIHGRTLKQFYRCSKYAYYSVGGLALITGARLYLESSVLPRPEQEKVPSGSQLQFSGQSSFYLPGLMELRRSDRRTSLLIALHAVVVFLNDVVMIYATMWFSEPADYEFPRYGQALIAGLEYGSAALLIYTVVDTVKIKNKLMHVPLYFSLSLCVCAVSGVLAFWRYSYWTFGLFCLSVGLLNQFYRHNVYNAEAEKNAVFERCIEITERSEKIFVLMAMPAVVLLGLGRDDIPDSLLWASFLALVGLVLFSWAGSLDEQQPSPQQQAVKATKIE